ncbi:tetratricopeptide repeat protein [Actinokineospora sp. NBRC 105648]|uniref:AfsR/SARP family transcriptional regulator n=1 Tax=Actinokineospora sp. NBRC 105648 TaxID=3032206 RepID=UPI0025575896|nr:tetratricopeptide repeat protein [Actinokineospora sp. NBRC 105648]
MDDDLHEDWAGPKPKAMLAALLLRPNRPLAADALARWVWTEAQRSPTRAASNLDTLASRIRKPLLRLPVFADLRGSSGTYRLDTDRAHIDFFQFRELAYAAGGHLRGGAHEEAARCAAAALELCRGRALEDLRSEVAAQWRTRFEHDELLPTHLTHLSALLALGRAENALVLLDDLQSEYSTNLALCRVRLSTLNNLGRGDEATEYYFTVRKWLLREGDDQAAEHLRRHFDSIKAKALVIGHAPAQRADLDYRPHRLPHEVADFVGRTTALEALDAAVGQAGSPARGVIVLEGMPGVGKTALAVHWGHRIRSRFPDGELFLELNGFATEPALTHTAAVDSLLLWLGDEPAATASRGAREVRLSRLLTGRNTLVVLDNVRNSDQIRELLPLLADCLVVVTTRQSLDGLTASYAIRRIRVNILSTEDSERLLALRLDPGADHGDPGDLVRICGGLPLAITILGENIAGYRLAGRAERPDLRGLLELGANGDGQTSPHAIFAFSYRDLAAAVRRMFRLLGMHPGAEFSLAAAAACAGIAVPAARDMLAALVGASLLERSDAPDRYRFHDLIRESAQHLADTEEDTARRRAAERRVLRYYLASASAADRVLFPETDAAPQLDPDPQVAPTTFDGAGPARTWFDTERANLGAAIALAARAGHHDIAWRLPHAVCTDHERKGRHEDCRLAREIAVAAARICGEEEAEASSASDLGKLYLSLGRLDDAREQLESALRFCVRVGARHGESITLFHLGRLELLRGQPERGIRLFERCVELSRFNNSSVLGWAHHQLGVAMTRLGRLNEALVHLRAAEHLALERGDLPAHANSLVGIGVVRRIWGDLGEAAAYCEQALEIAEDTADLALIAAARTELAQVECARGAVGTAEVSARRAVDLAEEIGHLALQARASDVLGNVLLRQGLVGPTARAWSNSVRVLDKLGDAVARRAVQAKLDALPAEPTRTTGRVSP